MVMGIYLSARELAQLESAEHAFPSPVPTQIISNGEFNPLPQTHQQQQVEDQLNALDGGGLRGVEPSVRGSLRGL
jgi:uncharacterized protein